MGYSIGKELIALPLSDGFSVEQIRARWRSHIAIMTQTQLPLTFSPNCHNRRLAVEMDRWCTGLASNLNIGVATPCHPVPSALATAS